ncbi:MAG: YihA family ribosome biogenesis GTP-binding protein [Rubrivivax sp.]|nr:YihA family ribosome biogenesis GTP-binding protein [Rubrivivax sp.]
MTTPARAPSARPTPSSATPGSAAAPPSEDAARGALAWLHSARFLTTASRLEQLPAPGLPEIAFVGRSNAGKSSAINALAQHKRLAFSSRTPGRTQHINLFEVGPRDRPDALLADLPGYGYAAVERSAKLRWQRVMADYLQARASLAGVVLLADSRLGLTDLDERLLALLAPRLAGGAVRLLVLLTKADKLSRREAQQALLRCEQALATLAADIPGEGEAAADIGVTLFSALSRQGLADVAEVLHDWRAGAA